MTKRRPPHASNFERTAYEDPIDFRRSVESSHTSTEYSFPSALDSSLGHSANTYNSASKRNSLFQKEVGQHETTRFSAVFFENQDSFGPVIDDVTNSSLQDPAQEPSQEFDVRRREHWPLMELAVNTLLNFPTARTCERLVEGIHYIYDVWVSPTMIQQCLDQVWREYGNCLGEHRTRESVSRMANDLFLNDKKPHTPPDNDFDRTGWINWFAGPLLRWEMIGILFSWAGMAFRHRQEWDPVFNLPEQQGRNRNSAAERMRECASACVRLCEDRFEISDIMVICMKNSIKLQSIIISDESDRIRVDYGTVGSAFITAGLHRLPQLQKLTPYSQYRACIASSMYYLDKCESLFNARPPMLSRHFCQYPLPLDLCEEDVYGGRERLELALARLDSNGWNTAGRIFTTTWLRALAMLSPIREGILELSLRINQQFTKEEVEDLVAQLRRIVASYPPHIRYDRNLEWPSNLSSGSQARSAHQVYIINRIQLDVLQCHFLLQRLLVSRKFNGGQDLFDIAQEALSIITSLWLHRDQLQDVTHAFDWISVSYGMPCAGILCIELLRASNLAPPSPATESSTSDVIHAPVQLSRSQVIQSLTMYKALLDWIRPTDNNAQLSSKLSKVLQRIIDTVFDSLGPLHGVQTQHSPNEQYYQRQYEMHDQQSQNLATSIDAEHDFDLDPALIASNDMDWLNTIDWTQGGWLEQSNQPFLR
ncbi:Hypothetical protein PENO1_054710 [Penicillium occitanis (nom. inval.)]|nr:Hypothetical protein PENO1_054710 [Penicillium occitanis (nom. inval.)]PCG99995.1 hypothetical protein PENOC_055470 [Penicillium occitanis (nom. inval.)]